MATKCMFCNFNEQYRIIKKYKFWTLVLADSQFILGWTHAILNRHVCSFDELNDKELLELKIVVKDAKLALDRAFAPDLMNIMQLGNMASHLHIHIVPRYKESRTFEGRTFVDKDFGKMIIDRWKIEDRAFLEKLTRYLQIKIK